MPSVSRPNILLCVFDSLSATHIASSIGASNSVTATPVVVKLRTQSVVFSSAYTSCPESSPARASLFTGLDPSVHGVWSNGVTLPSSELTLPQHLTHAGYTTWLVGRRQMAGVANWTTEHSRPDEFSHIDWAHGPLHRSRQNAYLNWLQETAPEIYAQIFPVQADPDNTSIPPEQIAAIASLPDELGFNFWVGLRSCELMASADKPFFGVAAFSTGATMGARSAREPDVEALNTRSLQQADEALGRILEYLNDSSLQADTVVIVTAARGTGSTANAMSESAINIPLLVRVPDQLPRLIDAPVSIIDIAPTILEIAAVPPKPRMQGISLVPVLNGATPFRNWAMSRLRVCATDSPDSENTRRIWQTSLRVNNMKLVIHHGNLQRGDPITYRLFDLLADPGEENDLSKYNDRADDLEKMIDFFIDARCALEDRTEPRIAQF